MTEKKEKKRIVKSIVIILEDGGAIHLTTEELTKMAGSHPLAWILQGSALAWLAFLANRYAPPRD